MIQQLVELYMSAASNGTATISEDIIDQFGEDCKIALRRQFSPREPSSGWGIATIGKPLCQQQMARAGAEKTNNEYNFVMKMLLGDMVEASAVAIMRGAKINIQNVQEQVTVTASDQELRGILDIEIDDVVWDIKSASPYAFTNKFRKGFRAVVDDDTFGYMTQGYLYAEAKGKPFGGWIAINKSTGEWCVCETPIADNIYKKQALKLTSDNIEKIKTDAPFKRCFDAIPETYYKKPTGNYTLEIACQYCPFNKTCWADNGYAHEYRESSRSKVTRPKHYVNKP